MLQGFFGFVLGVISTAVLLAYQPQLIGDLQQGMSDLGQGASQLGDRDGSNDVALSLTRRFAPENADTRDVPDQYADRNGYTPDQSADRGGYRPDQSAERSGDSWRGDSNDPSNDRHDRYSGDRTAGRGGASGACRGAIALENRSERSVEVHLHGQSDSTVTANEGDDTVDLRPGDRVERDVRAQGDCDRLNSPGGITVEAEICPLNDPQRAGTCHAENLPVDSGPADTAERARERQVASEPRG